MQALRWETDRDNVVELLAEAGTVARARRAGTSRSETARAAGFESAAGENRYAQAVAMPITESLEGVAERWSRWPDTDRDAVRRIGVWRSVMIWIGLLSWAVACCMLLVSLLQRPRDAYAGRPWLSALSRVVPEIASDARAISHLRLPGEG